MTEASKEQNFTKHHEKAVTYLCSWGPARVWGSNHLPALLRICRKKSLKSTKKVLVKFRSQEARMVKSHLGTHPRHMGQLQPQEGSFQEEMARVDQKMLKHIKQ